MKLSGILPLKPDYEAKYIFPVIDPIGRRQCFPIWSWHLGNTTTAQPNVIHLGRRALSMRFYKKFFQFLLNSSNSTIHWK